MFPFDGRTQARFWSKVDRKGEGLCWNWTGAKLPTGYGRFAAWSKRPERKCVYAHRYSYALHKGDIPEGLQVDHKCGNPSCVNPGHLQLATDAQNRQNTRARGAYRGVSKSHGGKWRARVMLDGKEYHLGLFENPEEAAEVARTKRLELFTHNSRDREWTEKNS